MHAETIRTALGQLQDDPDLAPAWEALTTAVEAPDRDLPSTELLRLLEHARTRHADRGEWEAVLRLLDVAIPAAKGSDAEPVLLKERIRVQRDELFDEDAALRAARRYLELVPDESAVIEAIEESEGKRGRWKDLVATYTSESEQAPDDVYKSSMLMRAAEMEFRFGSADADSKSIAERLEQSVRLDPSNVRAAKMLERVLRQSERWQDVARVLERVTDRAELPKDRIEAGVRLARLFKTRLSDPERAARAYERILRDKPDFAEAMAFLSEFYEHAERWDELCALYERDLKGRDLSSPERVGDMLQIAMLLWKKAARLRDAESWFERISRVEPTQPLVLEFYREFAAAEHDDKRLMDVLGAAQRAMKDGPDKTAISSEIARLAEGQANAQKAIEQYKGVLRQDPDNVEAREALKRLYKQTQGYNALVELLRQELERADPSDVARRVGILREVAQVYRQHLKSDTALVSVLNQIVQLDEKLDENDVVEVRELVQLYDKLQRWRDLLTNQLKLAEITPDAAEKKDLYRAVARRWLEQFSNVQNATDAYEALLGVDPTDAEARERLAELYKKRRAWPALYELYEREVGALTGSAKIPLLTEMAQLAAERLNRGADAVELYKQILAIEPGRVEVLDALEKHAERSKDWQTLASVLEKRVDATSDEAARLAVLQKLGGVYADHLGDHARAASAWRRVLELSPGHARALRVLRDAYLSGGDYDGLQSLYESQGDWEGLAEVLSTAADRAKDDKSKIDLSYRAAAVLEQHLQQPDRAFRSYERILSVDPTDARAARALIPLYEHDQKWARLPALYELLAEATDSTEDRLEWLKKLVDTASHKLSDKKAAAGYARRAYELSPGNAEALALLEETARAAQAFGELASALEARLESLPRPAAGEGEAAAAEKGKKRGKKKGREDAVTVPDGAAARASAMLDAEQRNLTLKLAGLYARELGRTDDSIAAYKRLLERDPADREVAGALDGLLREHDRRDELRWLLDLRVQHAPSDADKLQILSEWATLEEEVFESQEKAVELYRRILEVEPGEPNALRSLPRLLLLSDDAAGAAEVIERHRDRLSGDDLAQREVELAELYLLRLDRFDDALSSAVRALELSPGHARAMSVLEKLMERDSTKTRAAEVLATQYASGGDARREAQALSVMLSQTRDEAERLDIYSRLADVHDQKLGAHGNALDVMLAAVREFPTELSLWERADALAASAGRPTDLAEAYREILRGGLDRSIEVELCERAARLYEDKLGDPIGATPYLERVLKLDAGNERAFLRLKDILTAAERWSELEALYDRAAQATDDPARKAEMLVEVALVCEEIIDDAVKAAAHYERILDLDPSHDGAIRALDRLYARLDRHEDLARLLARRVDLSSGDELLELELRLARIELDRLHHPERAIGHVENVLRERPNDYDARELAEKLLAIGSMRGRAAKILEGVYEARDEIRDLVRVLGIRLEELDETLRGQESPDPVLDDERRELLRRVSRLRDERMHDDEGAFEALARLVPLDPLDGDSRTRLIEIGRRTGAHARVAEVLDRAAEKADTAGLRGEILMKAAAIHEDLLSDPARAEDTYKRVLALDESDAELVLPAARALERIYVASNQHKKLAEVLKTQVALEQEGDKRRELFGRLGELYQSVLEDSAGAVEAWKARLEEHPSDELALASLDALYEKTEDYRSLTQILDRRREVTEDVGLRRKLMVRMAEVQAQKLGNVSDAIEAWRAVVDEHGSSLESLLALEKLYQSAERWDDLAESYTAHLEVVQNDGERLELLSKLGDLKREQLNDLEGALDAYRRALTLDTGHAPSRAALEKLLDSEESQARREAAAILHPIYEGEGAHEPLLRVLEIEVAATDDPVEKIEALEKALHIAEHSLEDTRRAYEYAERALREAVGHTELGIWLNHLDRLASASGRHADQVKLLCDVVPNIFDGDLQLSVTLKVADLARQKLGDKKLAREYYEKALELRSEDRHALSSLESLYEEQGDSQSLLGIFERRIENAESDDERKTLLYRKAKLLSDALSDNAGAVGAYESILDIALEAPAIEALEGLYALEERWQDLVDLHRRQLDAGQGKPADLHVKMARVLAQRMQEVPRAFDELEEALGSEKQHEGAIGELERLMSGGGDAEHRARAAAILEPVYLLRADFGKVMESIQARLEVSQDPDERRELLSRLAQLYEEQKEDYVAALETTAKLLHEDLSDAPTITELERLAKVAGAEKRLAEIYAAELENVVADEPATANLARRAGEIFAGLGDNDRALAFSRRALAFEPESRELFDAVDAILVKTDRHAERVEHYRAALDHRFEPADRLAALHTIAELERKRAGNPDAAIETYRAALDVDERDERTLDALTELYRERERWTDLAELHLRRAESALDPEPAAPHRLALARLYLKELSEPDRAVDQLEEIVRGVPGHAEAVAELEGLLGNEGQKQRVVEILRPLYEGADDWKRLVRLNEDRYALAETPQEKVFVLRETARLWEERGRDATRACRALRVAVGLDPDDAETRAEFERLTDLTNSWDKLTETYEAALEESPDMLSRRDLLAKVAEVHDKRRDDPRAALGAYERLRQVDESDLDVLARMEMLATLLSDWAVLVNVLTSKAEYVLENEERASLWRRVGESKRDMLDDPAGAIAAYERALELDPESAFTVDCLIDLREGGTEAELLAELYQRRVELCGEDDAELKYDLLRRAAKLQEDKLSDRRKAIDLLGQALSIRAADPEVLRELDRLYRQEEMWPELLDNLKLEASRAESSDERARLRREMGNLLAEKLTSYDEALEAYRLVLDEAPSDAEALARVSALGREHEDLRLVVTGILIPVLRATERHAELTDALEMRLSVESDPSERAETLRTIAEVLDAKLGRTADAQAALLRALAERPDAADLHSEIERLSAAANAWPAYAEALAERAGSIFEPEVAKDLWARLGRIAEEQLSDDARAVEAYVRALEQAGEQPELLLALDRLHAKLGNQKELADVIERRIALEPSDAGQADLYHRLGMIQVQAFEEPARALASFRMALERAPEHDGAADELEKLTSERDLFEEAAEVLESVYRQRGKTDRLASLYEKRVGFADSKEQRIEMRKNLARVLEDDAKDPAAAQRVLQQGLTDDPSDAALLDEIERLAAITGNWEGAAAALGAAVDKNPELGRDLGRDLCVRIATWQRDKMEDGVAAERSLAKALELDPNSDDVLVLLEQVQRAPGRERDLVETLRRRAKLQVDEARREDAYREAKRLADGLGDAKLAESVVREFLEQDDANTWALAELTELSERAGDFAETFRLLSRRAELGAAGAEIRELRHRAAAIAQGKLDRRDDAIGIYEQLFEDDPQDRDAAAALRELYVSASRWENLGRLLERLVDNADSASERSALRIDLAKLNVERFQAIDAAVDFLKTVLEDEPGNGDAVVALSELYEKAQRDEELAELLSGQIEAARSRGDTQAELRFQVRLGEIYDTRLKNRAKAIETYQAVLDRDGSHRGALEALARLHQAGGDLAEAARILDRLIGVSEGADAVRSCGTLADVHEKLGDKVAAAAALERALGVDKADKEVRARLLALYEATESWEKLAAHLVVDAELAEGVDAQIPLLRRAADTHAKKRGDWAEASLVLEKASALRPDDRELLLALCDAYSASGKGKAAAAVLEKIVESYGGKRSKELAEIHRRLADAHIADGNTEKALEELDKAFRIEPGNVHVLKALGLVAIQVDDLKKAMQMFRALLLQKLEADSPITKAEVFFHLGEIHAKQNEKPKAIQMLERAIQADDKLERAKQLMAELKG
ncbi:MAG: hypothetical protein DYH12_11650 [Sorangiineae bacterium PRO1]|nr:hypothetical protein [Sorangiineae bacterium PRO1]